MLHVRNPSRLIKFFPSLVFALILIGLLSFSAATSAPFPTSTPTLSEGTRTIRGDLNFARSEHTPTSAMQVWTVTSTADDGTSGTLRYAINNAANGDSINFGVTGTIILTQGQLEIDRDLTITGPGATSLAISGNNASTVFQIDFGVTVSISGVTIENGSGSFNQGIGGTTGGGGISNLGTLTVSSSTFSANSAGSGPFASGGGIFNGYNATVTVANSTFTGNSAQYYAGGIFNDYLATSIVTSSTFSGNSGIYGGAISNYYGTHIAINTTFSANSAYDGGAIFNNFGMWTVINSTFSANSTTSGGGFTNWYATSTFKSTLLANGSSGGNCYNTGTFNSAGYNLSDDNSCSSFLTATGDINNIAAGLDSAGLASNGGPTRTIALLANSPAVNAIPVSACTDVAGNPVTTDQRGVTRPQGPSCDIGAFEVQGISNSPPTIRTVTISRQQGAPPSNSTIATVSDAQDPAGSLIVIATSVPPGISVTHITNTNGTITADVAASCKATLGNNTIQLTVLDSGNLTTTANLIVNVTLSPPPTPILFSISLSNPVSKVSISQPYGQNRKCYDGKCKKNDVDYYHTGIDYSNAGGLDILAAADGTVIRIPSEGGKCFNHGLGNTIIIEHTTPNGPIYTLYGHLSKILVTLGQKVKRGDKIAKMGNNCAETTTIHLHFELKSAAVLENPIGTPCGLATCEPGVGNKCYGYTQGGSPDNFGYYDPVRYITAR
jgi:murein DD-endopeptidase MepM/ murein hydrolase activator NlpD